MKNKEHKKKKKESFCLFVFFCIKFKPDHCSHASSFDLTISFLDERNLE